MVVNLLAFVRAEHVYCLMKGLAWLTGNCLLLAVSHGFCADVVHPSRNHLPTLELASVKLGTNWNQHCILWHPCLGSVGQRKIGSNLFRVVLFPEEGLPTNPMSGSRGMVPVDLMPHVSSPERHPRT